MFSSNTAAPIRTTAVVFALAVNACAAHEARPTSVAYDEVTCVGGVIASAADAALYAACATIAGDLRVSAADIDDLSARHRLRRLSGKLEIAGNAKLDDLSGLERLEHVGELSVHDNPELRDLSGLDSLREASRVTAHDNRALVSMRGREGLTNTDRLVIERNGLYATSGLSNLARVGELVVRDNPRLNSLRGLHAVERAGWVKIQNNPRLCARNMLPSLIRVEGALEVSDNRMVTGGELRSLLSRVEQGVPRPPLVSPEASLR